MADIGKKIGKETKQFTEITSLQWEIRSLEKAREEKITQLGRLLYDLCLTGETEVSLPPESREILAEIKEIDEKIVRSKKQ